MSKKENTKRIDNKIETRLEQLEAQRGVAKWWRRATLLLLVGAISVPFMADALGPVPNSFSGGAVISASEMNENFTYLQNAITALEDAVPTGTVGYFNLASCPTGWDPYAAADGRVIVGGVAGATDVGTALGPGGLRNISSVPAHSHTLSGSASASTVAAHNHSASSGNFNSAHTHGGTTSTIASHDHVGVAVGNHTHTVATRNNNNFSTRVRGADASGGTGTAAQVNGGGAHTPNVLPAGSHNHTFTTGSGLGNHSHSVTVNNGGAHTHSINTSGMSVASAGSATVDVTMPYHQLLACVRL